MGVYLDNQSARRPSKQVVEAMLPYLHAAIGLRPDRQLLAEMERAYRALYGLVAADEEDHAHFTSSGAEAVGQVILGAYIDITRKTGRNHFVAASDGEAPTVLALEKLQELGCCHELALADAGGVITKDAIAETITPRTALVSLSWANGLTGVIHPVHEIGALCVERGIAFHVDATHVLGNGHFPFEESGAHFLTFNGEQLHGPKGSGALFIRKGSELGTPIVGSPLNHAALIGLGVACTESAEQRDFICTEVARLRADFERTLLEELSDCTVLHAASERLPHISAIAFEGVASDALLFLLNRKEVYATFGGGQFQHISNLRPKTHTALSFSLSRETTQEQLERATGVIIDAVNHLRKVSDGIRRPH